MSSRETTRLSLHAVAELLLAGPQYVDSKTIKLRVTTGGFGTILSPEVRVEGTSLVRGDQVVPLDGRTIAEVAAAVDLTPHPLGDLYQDAVEVSADHVLSVDPGAVAEIADAFRVGQAALTSFTSGAEPVLWPEHFDLGISVDEVNYGVSAGDGFIGVPYAYVGPWHVGSSHTAADFSGPFWNAPFGSAHPLTEIDDLAAYFAEGQRLTSLGP